MNTQNTFEQIAKAFGDKMPLLTLPPGLAEIARRQMKQDLQSKWQEKETITFRKQDIGHSVKSFNDYLETGTTVNELSEAMAKMAREAIGFKADELVMSALLLSVAGEQEPKEQEPDKKINQLKKQLKYCKNPMEAKRINKQINMELKQRKKRRSEGQRFQ